HNLIWAANLSLLESIDMCHVNLSTTNDHFATVLSTFHSLELLSLSHRGLYNTYLPHTSCLNSTLSTNIQHQDLSNNLFKGGIPCFLCNMTSLHFLDLFSNQYTSLDPHFLLSRNLQYLNLEGNSLNYSTDWISNLLWDKCHLKSLNLGNNHFHGDISVLLIKNLSRCWSHNLENLELWSNDFNGQFPKELGELKQLKELDLSDNKLTGPIPINLSRCWSHNMENLELWSNNFYGQLPEELGKLKQLKWLDLSDNNLSGPIPTIVGQLSDLEWIDIYGNTFEGTLIEAHFKKLFKLKGFRTGSNMLTFRNLLSGHLPQCWANLSYLRVATLSSNKLSGPIPNSISGAYSLGWLQLSNSFIRKLPPNLKNCTQLMGLDIGDNKLSGKVPEWIGNNLLNLAILRLRNNKFYGDIPSSF
ncbi:LRR receptor-like serine/threonine-protein kinase FLS2, partial [Striga hermonthica]